MHEIRFRLGLMPRISLGNLQCSPDPLAGLRGHISKGEEREEKRKERAGERKGGEGTGGAGVATPAPLTEIPGSAPWCC